MSRLGWIAGAVLVAGCGVAPLEQDVVDDVVGPGGKADGAGPPVIETELGAAFPGLSIEALAPGATPSPETLQNAAIVFRFDVEAGTTFAATMRGQSGDLDSVLVLQSDTATAMSRDQAYLPMAAPHDAMLVHTAAADETVILIATSEGYASSGEFALDLVALPEHPGVDLGWGGRGPELLTESLREREPTVAAYVGAGYYVEGADGLLAEGPDWTNMTLRERSESRAFVAAVNRDREELFHHAVSVDNGYEERPTPEQRARVGRVLGALWASLR